MNKTGLSIIILISVFLLGVLAYSFIGRSQTQSAADRAQNTNQLDATTEEASSSAQDEQVKIEDLTIGEGKEAKSGDTVTVNYKGTLPDGTQFDSSYDRNEPFTTQIGVGDVIKGWDQGIPGMKVGGKRRLTIPPSLGYGSTGQGAIPPNSTLIFEVELVDVK